MRINWLILAIFLASCVTPPQTLTQNTPPSQSLYLASSVKNFAMVDDGVYRSGRPLPADFKMLAAEYKIKNVVSLEAYWFENKIKVAEKAAVTAAGMNYYNIPIAPIGGFDDKKVAQAINLLRTLERPILVHCLRGSERTGVVVAGYRVLENKWLYKDAFAEMDKYGFSPFFKGWKHELKEMIERK